MRISDWSSDVCSSDLFHRAVQIDGTRPDSPRRARGRRGAGRMTSPVKLGGVHHAAYRCKDAKETVAWYERMLGMTYTTAFAEDHVPSTGAYDPYMHVFLDAGGGNILAFRSEEHPSELKSLLRISYAVFCLKKKKYHQ